jgi:4-methyl-5(b-hydroxyethyl)-thiazole monophosphate biosynthesis
MLTLATRSSALRSLALRAAATTSAGAQKRVLVPIADGSEEIETSCITDTLVRAGAEVTVASVEATTTCTMSRGLKIVADALDAILRKQDARQAPLAAVCASPAVILKSKGLIDGRQATCYPAPPFVEALGDVSDGAVVRDGHITTSRGPGTSLKFALDLVDQLYGPEKAEELRAQMLVD